MKLYRRLIVLLFIFLFIRPASAQLSNWGNNEFYVCEGMFTLAQFEGVFGNTTNATDYMSFPYTISGAAFLTYRHYFDKKIAVGFTIGLDNQTGDLSYGREGIGGYYYNTKGGNGEAGYYKREVYTGAIELLVNYRSEYKYKVYGYIGAGYTSTRVTFNYFNNISAQSYFYGTPGSMFLRNNTTVDFSHYSGQITPIGFRRGETIAAFIEFGFGYKGLISGGLSVKFNNGKHKPLKMVLGSSDETILLPYDFPVRGNLQYVARVETGKIRYNEPCSFKLKLENILSKTNDKKANIFRITKILAPYQDQYYHIWGHAYYTSNFDSFKTKVLEEKNKKFENGKCAYVIIYRPGYNYTRSGHENTDILINDSIALQMEESSRYIYRISKEGTWKIALKNSNEIVNIDVKFGKEYYVKTYIERSGFLSSRNMPARIFSVDNIEGDLESSVIDNAHHIQLTPR